jgi:hypothetical protein
MKTKKKYFLHCILLQYTKATNIKKIIDTYILINLMKVVKTVGKLF